MKEPLDSVTLDGMLAPWLAWWPPEVVEELLPDATSRSLLESDMPRVPRAFYEEDVPVPDGWAAGPCAYVKLSNAYADEYQLAAERHWSCSTIEGHHLSIVTDAAVVTAAITNTAGSWTSRTLRRRPDAAGDTAPAEPHL